jgi:lipopolysaccharide assembly outer membrane protein LptD (OstA)
MFRFTFLIHVLIGSILYANAYSSPSPRYRQQQDLEHLTLLPDTLPPDTLRPDTMLQSSRKVSADSLDSPVRYQALQKTWMDLANKKVYLLGEAEVQYKDITLQADSIVFDWGNNEVIAIGRKDSSGKPVGQPVFLQGDREYKAERIAYNFKTRKGKITEITTMEGEGFIRSETVKRLPNEVLYGKNNSYTTCSYDHPHFFIDADKIKVIPNKAIVTGAANLVVADVRTPLVVPFGIFPVSSERKSGIIIPEYGEREDLGFYLRRGGYYFGLSDHFDLALTGDIYSRGSWLVNASSRYISRYKFSGNFSVQYANTRVFLEEENDYATSAQFNVRLTYQQDSRARPYSNFNANVAFGTSGFNSLFGNPLTTYVDNIYQSSISYRQTIPNSPFNFTVSASHQQSTLTHLVNLQLPVLNFSMSQLYPFKRKLQVGQLRWYEKIGLTYTLDARNQVSSLDSLLFTQNTLTNSLAGARHSIPVSAPFQLFKHLTISPSFSFTETWTMQTFNRSWDAEQNRLVTDTVQQFKAGREYSLSAGTSTRVYGMFQFKKGKIRALRHVMNPSVNYSYRPDFSDPRYGYYQTVQIDTAGNEARYSYFQGGVYPGPSGGKYSGMGFALGNTLEMKVASKKDTVSGLKKIKLLEALNLSGNYNFAADSLRLSVINLSGRTTLFDKIGINFASTFDPYIADTNGRRVNTFVWEVEKRLVRITGANLGLDAQFASPNSKTTTKLTQQQLDYLLLSGNQYSDFNIPWTFGFGYSLFLRKVNDSEGQDSTTFTQTLRVNGSFNLTPKWRVSGSTSYDFVNREFPTAYVEIFRDLHCWEMSMSWIPFGIRQSYQFTIRVKAGVLQDLKLSKQSDWYDY